MLHALIYACVCLRACVRTITGDRALTINTLFNMRRLRGNNYEKEFADMCVLALAYRHMKQTRSLRHVCAHVLMEISRLLWILLYAISRSGKCWIFVFFFFFFSFLRMSEHWEWDQWLVATGFVVFDKTE